MGRSVYVPSDATHTAYIDLTDEGECDDDYSYHWDSFLDSLSEAIQDRYKSFERESNQWEGREGRVILSNGHARIVVAEYCGCVSVSLLPNECPSGYYTEQDGLHRGWCERVGSNFVDLIRRTYPVSCILPLGTMSNGVTVYQRAGG